MKLTMIAIVGLATVIFACTANANPYVISDDRVRSLDITPVLGRGYSIVTNSFQSTCIDVEETTVPSYNYDYTYHDFTTSTNLEDDVSNSMGYSLSHYWFKAKVQQNYSNSRTETSETRYLTAVMRIERYYTSIREEASPINAMATSLLQRQDYVGFFKSCGPNFIRGIRRAQEVTASLEFQSQSTETAAQFSLNVQASSRWWNQKLSIGTESKSSFRQQSSTLKISIVGYGLGLSSEGSESLIATSLTEYINVMKFAYNSMVNAKNGAHIGQVYGIEVLPWAESVRFQVAAGVQEENIDIPLKRSVLPRAYRISDPSDNDFVREERPLFKCRSPEYVIDKFGYCCESSALYDVSSQEYDPFDPDLRICRPVRTLTKDMVKQNMAANGEFVARLDNMLRYKTNQMFTFEKCLSAVRAIPGRFDFHVLKNKEVTGSQKAEGTEIQMTPFEMKMALDPFNDYKLLTHMAMELDEWNEMFYTPCMASMFGINIAQSSETDPSYFMAYPWYNHEACLKLSCFGLSTRWDRRAEGQGCIPSVISGTTSVGYDWNDSRCAKNVATGGDQEDCKYDSEGLYKFHNDIVTCWSETLPAGRIDYFVDHFCMPEITGTVIDDADISRLQEAYTDFCLMNPNSNSPSVYPSLRPTAKPSIEPSSEPSLSKMPSLQPSVYHSEVPSQHPSEVPSLKPSVFPSGNPTTAP